MTEPRTAEPLRAGIYCRLSLARYGDTTKVDEQERISRALSQRLGWQLAEGCGYPEPNGVYVDNNKSAWQKNVKRVGWNQMLADVGDGKLDAIVVYHGDRLIRRPRDLEDLIDLAENKGIRLASPTGVRNLDDSQERTMLRVLVAFQCGSSDDTSRRMKDDLARRQRNGVVNSGGRGGRLFGFTTDSLTHVPQEAAIVREVFTRFLQSEGVRHIAAALAARGVITTAGKPMHPIAVRRMLANPRYAGLMPDGASSAAWDPIVEREDWETATAVLDGRGGLLPPGHNARKYLLSGIATCGTCGATLQVLPARASGPARYMCRHDGCSLKVYRDLHLLDGYVSARVVQRLNHPASPPGRLPALPGLAGELRALAAEREQVEAAVADHTKGRLPLLLARLDSLDTRLAQIRELTGASAQARLLRRHEGLSPAGFAALQLPVRRALVSACYKVVVLPASARGPGFRVRDVELTPR